MMLIPLEPNAGPTGGAAGAMIYVAVEELVPGAQEHKNTDIATGGVMAGFLIMMLLDTTLV